MKVSILLAVYNGEKYLKKSIDSIISQSYKDWELLIGFNGTKDSSKNIANEYSDSRIRIFDYGDDAGKAKTLNKMLKEITGEVIAIQDDDDIWLPKKMEHQMKYIEDYDVIGTQIVYINENEEFVGGPKLCLEDIAIKTLSLNGNNQVANTSAIVKTEVVKKLNGWKEDLDGIEDFDLWLRLMKSDYKFKNLNTVEVWHRVHSKSNFNTKKHDLNKILYN